MTSVINAHSSDTARYDASCESSAGPHADCESCGALTCVNDMSVGTDNSMRCSECIDAIADAIDDAADRDESSRCDAFFDESRACSGGEF